VNKARLRLLLVFVFFFLFFSAPQQVRKFAYSDSMIGTTTYFHVRMAEMLLKGQLFDPLSFGGRPYTYPPGFHLLLAGFLSVKEFLLPFIGALGLVLCYYFARELGFNDEEALTASGILGLIPGYVYLSGHLNPRMPALLLMILTFFLIKKAENNPHYEYLASITFMFALLTHPFAAFIGALFGLILFIRRINDVLVPLVLGGSIFVIAWLLPLLLFNGIPPQLDFYHEYIELRSGVQYFVFEAAVVSDSIGALTIIAALYSALKLKTKGVNFLKLWLFLSIAASMIVGNRLNEMMLFPVAMLAAKTVISLWSEFTDTFHLTDFVKNNHFWLAGFLFYSALAGLLAAGSLMYFPPSPADYSAMLWIRENTPEDSVVMGYWQDGHWITGIAQRKNVIDAYAEFAPDVDDRYYSMLKVMEGSDVDEALKVLRKYNVKYIYYPLINKKYCTGFSYLSRYPYFEKVFSSGDKFVFKVDYSGKAVPFDLCDHFIKDVSK